MVDLGSRQVAVNIRIPMPLYLRVALVTFCLFPSNRQTKKIQFMSWSILITRIETRMLLEYFLSVCLAYLLRRYLFA